MGYTHYFKPKGNRPTETEWRLIKKEVKQILDENIKIICREYDRIDEYPLISNNEIIFNGKGEDGHETFYLSKDIDDFEFCKTAEKPYDAVVVLVLKKVKEICPNWLKLSSDGGDSIFE